MTRLSRIGLHPSPAPVSSAAGPAAAPADPRPLVLHVVYRFDVGGLENGVVNLIDHLPAERWRHAVLALTEVTDFKQRVRREDVQFIALKKPPGQGVWLYPRMCRLVRALAPAIVHTRNLAALEMTAPAWWAGAPVRIHGEHGRDVDDLHGRHRGQRWMRRAYRPFVDHYVALSRDLADYLVEAVGVPAQRVTRLCNGVDTVRFHPAEDGPAPIEGCPFSPQRHWLIGSVGRMQAVKDPLMLVRAFGQVLEREPALRARLRLVMVGDGPLRAEALALLQAQGLAAQAWLPGERSDVPAVMRGLHCFALPSLAEGISNTLLEAMASGLPVVATAVGGNAELVEPGLTGALVAAGDAQALADHLLRLARAPDAAARMGRAGRAAALQRFSLQAMVAAYGQLYDTQLALAGGFPRRP